MINLNKLQTTQTLVWVLQSVGIHECQWSHMRFSPCLVQLNFVILDNVPLEE